MKHQMGMSLLPTTSLIPRPAYTDDGHVTRVKTIGFTRDGIFRGGKRNKSCEWTEILTHHSVFDHHELERREFF